ncbi:hyaluronidase-3 [Kryptolebias marmoratus]|uniref:Hyaluronidase n=1 Tax=Kryptolebias marmoratus TaxID=37003 RepID=A0A3Q2ZH49_KRYMA|nr:hyaluronidase-3 [Kryptolebias marmoratus]XP_017266703.1 hyaluronidase-3 [Kryptolebias marmoratus]XP_024860619.1 hyaluronidase-3 [Kryptolebias marmoratus]XP_037832780.1 hyaluronidase-3 [Kryptolebias marmoratus]
MVLPLLSLLVLLVSPSSFASSSSQNLARPGALIHKAVAAAAGPALQNQPFTVVWNMPTAKCQKHHNVQLDLEEFDIVENQKQRFQGQRMTIFYRDHLGKYPYLSHGGRKVNGGLPQLGDLSAHLALTVKQLSILLHPKFSGMAVIDWEEWEPLWASNLGSKMEYRRLSKLLVRQERPGLLEKDVKLLARQQFEESARRFMEETLRLAVKHRPKGFWGFYGFPSCFNKHKRKTDQTYTGRCHKGTRQNNDQLSWLWTQSTALYPSIYLPQRLAGSADAALMVRHRLLEALRVASIWRHGNKTVHATPVLPYARLAFTHSLSFLNQTDLEHTLGESASLGAAGVVLWGDMKFAKSKQQCILLRKYVHSVLGPFIQSLRSDTQSCSLQLCHGNGRCTRRRPSSSHRLSSASVHTSDPHGAAGPGSSGYFHRHFLCQCFPGWTGTECHENGSGQNRD